MFKRRGNLGPTVAGLDLGSSSLKVAYIQDGIPLLMDKCDLPRGAVVRGRIEQPQVVEKALRRLWQKAGVPSTRLRFIFANQSTLIRPWTLTDPGSKSELQQAIETNANIILDPYDPDTAVLNAHEIGRDEKDVVSLLLAAAERDDVQEYESVIKKAKLKQTGCEPTAVAQIHAFDIDPEKPTAVVSVGAELTLVAIAYQGETQYLRVVPIGGNDFTLAASKAHKENGASEPACSFEACEEMKRRFGIVPVAEVEDGGDADLIRESQKLMTQATENLIQEVTLSIEHYISMPDSPSIEGGILCGGGARMAGLREMFSQYGMPADKPKPATWALGVPDVDLFGAALGVSAKRTFDLTPTKQKKKRKKKKSDPAIEYESKKDKGEKKKSSYWLTALFALLGAGLLVGAWQHFEAAEQREIERELELRQEASRAQNEARTRIDGPEGFISRNELARELVFQRTRSGWEAVNLIESVQMTGGDVQSVETDPESAVVRGRADDDAYENILMQAESMIGTIEDPQRSGNNFVIRIDYSEARGGSQ